MHNHLMKQFLTICLTLVAFTALGQKEVVSAYNANKSGNYAEAVTYIEQALLNEKAAVKEKTWRYRGDIYVNVAKDSLLMSTYPNALKIAYDSYLIADSLDSKGSYESEISSKMMLAGILSSNKGISCYNDGDFAEAGRLFDLAFQFSEYQNVVDTVSLDNAALSYTKAGSIDEAIARYQSLADIGYNVPEVYFYMGNLLRDAGRTEDALSIYQNARLMYPKNQDLIIQELNIYIESKDYERALSNLKLAIDLDPENEILWFSLGSIYDRFDSLDQAITAYTQAIQLEPRYFDANFNLGAIYYNIAAQKTTIANDMTKPRMSSEEIAEQEKYDTEAAEYLELAKPFMEMAHDVDPANVDALRSLRDIYARTHEEDKLNRILKLLNTER